jgi:hypothetical protein
VCGRMPFVGGDKVKDSVTNHAGLQIVVATY